MKPTLVKPRYDLIIYDGRQFSKDVITKEDFLAMKRDTVDHVLAIDLGLWCFRTADGQWIERNLSEVSIGEVSLKLLECMQCEPGEYFAPGDIAEITLVDSMRNPNNLSARLRALRISHRESAIHQNFFLSKRTGGMGVAWNETKTFMQVYKIPRNG